MRPRRFVLAVCLALATGTALAVPAGAESLPGTAVVPPHLGTADEYVYSTIVTPSGYVAVGTPVDGGPPTIYYRSASASSWGVYPGGAYSLIGMRGDDLALHRSTTDVRFFDTVTQTSHDVSITGTVVQALADRTVLGSTPGAAAGTYVVRRYSEGVDPVTVATVACASAPYLSAADTTALAFECDSPTDSAKDDIHLLRLADGNDTLLASIPSGSAALLQLSESTVAWWSFESSGGIATVPRDGSAPYAVRSLPGVPFGYALRGDHVAWATAPESTVTLHVAPVDAAQDESSFEATGLGNTHVDPGPEGFVIRRMDDGFAKFAPGDTALTYYLDLPPAPAFPLRVALDHGRLLYADDASGATYARAVTDVAGTTSVGAESVLATDDWGGGVVVSGQRVARIVDDGVHPAAVVVTDGGTEIRRVYVTEDLDDLALSGRRLLLSYPDASLLVELTSGSVTLPAGAVLWGRYVAYVDGSHRVVRRDLDAPLSATNPVVVRPATPAWCPGCTAPSPDDVLLSIYGDTVFWYVGNVAEDAAVSRISGTTVTRGPIAVGLGETFGWATLGPAGLVVATGSGETAWLTLFEVDSVLAGAANGSHLGETTFDAPPAAVDGRYVAWAGTDWAFRVVASPYATARPAWLLSSLAPSAFSPNGDGSRDAWSTAFDADAPLSAWTLTVRNAAGSVVATRTGSAPLGAVRTSWNGRTDATSALVPDGTYTWTLAGTSAGGVLRRSDGAAAPITGTVAVRAKKPVATLHVPVVSTAVSPTPAFPVSWGTTSPGVVSYDVSYQELTKTATGAWVLGPVHAWKSATTVKSATFPGAAGHTYRFLVRARDDAGNIGGWTHGTTVTPYDERTTLATYAGTWSSATVSGRYVSTLRSANARGAQVTFTGYLNAFRLVGDRCATCGTFTVYVDGHLIGTVDTYASSTRARQVLWSAGLGSTVAKHTIVLVVNGTSGRPKVVLDGFAATR